ncbi:MAG: AraC-like DNA-binding protein, partial [bacterium]
LDTVKDAGIDPIPLLEIARIQPALLRQADARIFVEQLFIVYEEAARLTDDQNFGFHMGKQGTNRNLIVEYIFLNSKTLSDSFANVMRYTRLIADGFPPILYQKDNLFHIEIQPLTPALSLPKHPVETTFAFIINRIRQVLGDSFAPQAIYFKHNCNQNKDEYAEFFQSPVYFEQKKNKLVFHTKQLDIKIPKADSNLQTFLTQQANLMLEQLPKEADFTAHTQKILIEKISTGQVTASSVAEDLGISLRTFQRRLKDLQTTFQEQLNVVRQSLAKHYLKDKKLPIFEIAFLLGFTEQSTFTRAFKRWNGTTPAEYRKQIL